MIRERFIDGLRRAARQHPAWIEAKVYQVSADGSGDTILDDDGELQYDLIEETWGMLDLTRDDDPFTASQTYEGDTRLTLLTALPVNDVEMIIMGGVPYSAKAVVKADAMQASVTFLVNAHEDTPTIRIDTL